MVHGPWTMDHGPWPTWKKFPKKFKCNFWMPFHKKILMVYKQSSQKMMQNCTGINSNGWTGIKIWAYQLQLKNNTFHAPWSMDHGPWSMVHGPWSTNHGRWSMDDHCCSTMMAKVKNKARICARQQVSSGHARKLDLNKIRSCHCFCWGPSGTPSCFLKSPCLTMVSTIRPSDRPTIRPSHRPTTRPWLSNNG